MYNGGVNKEREENGDEKKKSIFYYDVSVSADINWMW